MKPFLTSPLFHFVLAGTVLYLFFGRPDPELTDTGDRSREIVITEGRIENLVTIFQKTWQRPPTAAELQGMIDDFVQEEIYYREAIALGLDRDDTLIRRRMRQKIEFLTEDLTTPDDPGDEVLGSFLDDHPDSYRQGARFTLTQVFLDPEKHREGLEAHARELIARLETRPADQWSAEELAELGDGLALLGNRHEDISELALDRDFGKDFSATLSELPEEKWTGPLPSGYGFHLVHIAERTPGRLPELAEVREAVLRDWSSSQRNQANERLYESLFHRYTVTFERADGTRRVVDSPTPLVEADSAALETSADSVPSRESAGDAADPAP